jgi:hypothetical protein
MGSCHCGNGDFTLIANKEVDGFVPRQVLLGAGFFITYSFDYRFAVGSAHPYVR